MVNGNSYLCLVKYKHKEKLLVSSHIEQKRRECMIMLNKTKDINIEKVLKKYSPSEKREVIKAFDKLKNLIDTEESYGTMFEQIFNNETIKYDILGSGFYTFKAQGRDRSQMRLLYHFTRLANGEYNLQLHKVYIKRKSGKEYMTEFASYVEEYAR